MLGGDGARGNMTTSQSLSISRILSGPLMPRPKCEYTTAYCMELQIRSADEPMTICMVSLRLPFLAPTRPDYYYYRDRGGSRGPERRTHNKD